MLKIGALTIEIALPHRLPYGFYHIGTATITPGFGAMPSGVKNSRKQPISDMAQGHKVARAVNLASQHEKPEHGALFFWME